MDVQNLYIHFPFCRRKCSYCALLSRAGTTQAHRDAYVRTLADRLSNQQSNNRTTEQFSTVYFGGGSPALCDLKPLFAALRPLLAPDCEFTVELHPLDVTEELLGKLRDGGVNRISMGVQSLDDDILVDMGRGYTVDEAVRAFALVKRHFNNAGIDLIVGYPKGLGMGDGGWKRLREWGLAHCSVYSLILEENSILGKRYASGRITGLPSDDEVMDTISGLQEFLKSLGLERYEISNYALPGHECRHNLAVWRGEDYLGLGEGAHGRLGLNRTIGVSAAENTSTAVTPEEDLRERTLFRLRTREGLDITRFPEWKMSLDGFVEEHLLTCRGNVYFLTDRGAEVCDSILAELV